MWYPWLGDPEIKPLRFEMRTGTFVMILRSPTDAGLGKHRHRGTVTAVTLKGEWNYLEYDWTGRPHRGEHGHHRQCAGSGEHRRNHGHTGPRPFAAHSVTGSQWNGGELA